MLLLQMLTISFQESASFGNTSSITCITFARVIASPCNSFTVDHMCTQCPTVHFIALYIHKRLSRSRTSAVLQHQSHSIITSSFIHSRSVVQFTQEQCQVYCCACKQFLVKHMSHTQCSAICENSALNSSYHFISYNISCFTCMLTRKGK